MESQIIERQNNLIAKLNHKNKILAEVVQADKSIIAFRLWKEVKELQAEITSLGEFKEAVTQLKAKGDRRKGE